MADVAIRVEGLGKSYQIRHQRSSYRTLRDDLVNLLPGRKQSGESKETFWALRDVNFDVKTGEVLGVIGRNGAGKSTLLKILARITKPSTGYADIFGRVGSLLEVGTGFHPELTGRENIFLSGTILGMRRHEIQRKFDEIVEFAEVEQFLDTPVKRFSSGMYTRLAFSVAAHLDPEILIVDEVLAVGDAAFQKKSLGKMGDVAQSGRTVLFVSHNMAAVANLCSRGIVLEYGRVIFDGTQSEAILRYATSVRSSSALQMNAPRKGIGGVRISGIEMRSADGTSLEIAHSGQDIDVFLHFDAEQHATTLPITASILLSSSQNVPVFLHHNRLNLTEFGRLPEHGAFVCRLNRLPLPASIYSMTYSLMSNGELIDSIQDAAEIQVVEGDFYGSGEVPPSSHGLSLVDAQWRLVTESAAGEIAQV